LVPPCLIRERPGVQGGGEVPAENGSRVWQAAFSSAVRYLRFLPASFALRLSVGRYDGHRGGQSPDEDRAFGGSADAARRDDGVHGQLGVKTLNKGPTSSRNPWSLAAEKTGTQP
jgi:hypothetical protein